MLYLKQSHYNINLGDFGMKQCRLNVLDIYLNKFCKTKLINSPKNFKASMVLEHLGKCLKMYY